MQLMQLVLADLSPEVICIELSSGYFGLQQRLYKIADRIKGRGFTVGDRFKILL